MHYILETGLICSIAACQASEQLCTRLQVMGILAAMTFVRFGLEPLVKLMRRLFVAPGSWEKSSEFYILREVAAHPPVHLSGRQAMFACMQHCMQSPQHRPAQSSTEGMHSVTRFACQVAVISRTRLEIDHDVMHGLGTT